MTLQTSKPLDATTSPRPNRAHFITVFLLTLVIITAGALPVVPSLAAKIPDLGPADEPWHIVADDLSLDNQTGEYVARGDVTITKGDRRLKADFIRFNQQTMQVSALGNIVLTTGQDVITANRLEIDLQSEKGTIHDGTLFIEANHFYITGHRIEKVGPDAYKAQDVSVTTCDGDTPDWKLTARDLEITIEGYGVARHSKLWAKRVPVLYAPWFMFPVKLERQTGLLPPQFGYATRRGFEYTQPLFWAINQNTDATLYGQYMQKRGFKAGAEYRYVLSRASKGTLMMDGFEDRKIDDGSPDATRDWGYAEDDYARPNTDRWWFRMKSDQALPFDFKAQLDLDLVSDQDYLREFRTGYIGFDDTREQFFDNYRREIDEYNDTVRVNRLGVNRTWSSSSLNAEIRYYDDVIKRRWEPQDDTLHKLPYINYSIVKQSLGTQYLYLDFDSEYTHFYREYGTRGHRLDLTPRIFVPLRLFERFALVPAAGWRETLWAIDQYENQADAMERIQNRSLYDLNVDLSTDFFATWDTQLGSVDGIKHTVRPRIVYNYIPNQAQDNLPDFDPVDRISALNSLTYSLTNVFITRSQPILAQSANPANAQPLSMGDPVYTTTCRLLLEQSYDINEASSDNPADWSDPNERQPFSPVYGKLDITPREYFSIIADAEWSPYDNNFLTHNVAARLFAKRGDHLHVEHRYTEEFLESIYIGAKLKLSRQLTGYGDYERNLLDGFDIRSSVGLLYEAQCWSTNIRYIEETDDKKINVEINLFGLGGIRY